MMQYYFQSIIITITVTLTQMYISIEVNRCDLAKNSDNQKFLINRTQIKSKY